MNEKEYKRIIIRYLSKKASVEEVDEFFHLLNDNDPDFLKVLNNIMDHDFANIATEQNNIEPLESDNRSAKIDRGNVLLVACIFIFAIFSIYFSLQEKTLTDNSEENVVFVSRTPDDSEFVELILPDGKSINLENDSSRNSSGSFKNEKGVFDFYSDENVKSSKSSKLAYHTIKTPAGKSINILLPDGSEVWLNASSSVRFPKHFVDGKREVFAEGEVYFKVKRDVNRPYIVNSDLQSIKVLGTEFNIDSYGESEEIKTTLISGEIEVHTNGSLLAVSPGVQAVINKSSLEIQSKEVDISDVTAWKQGFFRFNNIDIKTIMEQISRWYGINVKFQGVISNDLFMGRFARNKSIEEFVEFLKKAKINAEFSDNTLIVKN